MVKSAALVFGMTLAILLAAAACGGGGSGELEIRVKVNQGQLNPETVRVKQGDKVTLRIESDQAGDFHLHGYDIQREVLLGQVADLSFVADATGRFKITFHAEEGVTREKGEHKHKEERSIGFLEVRP